MWCSTVWGIVTFTLSMLAAPLAAGAQQTGKVARVGYLAAGPITPGQAPTLEAFRQGLRALG